MSKPILAAMLSCEGTSLTDAEKKLFSKCNPLGITLFNRNIKSVKQVKALTEEIKNVINRDNVLIAVDQEGGRVCRLSGISDNKYVSADVLGLTDVKYSRMHAEIISHQLYQLGINVNYAPIVEKITTPQSKVLEGRCLSSNVLRIKNRAKVMADTYIEKGICPCIKHIPGHFTAKEDPHLQQLVCHLSIKDLYKEMEYMRDFNTYPMAMSSHIILETVDSQYPVTMSKKCVDTVLRGFLGYKNFIISDAIDMHALRGNIENRARYCLEAGIDVICYCSGKYEDLYKICQQKIFLTEKSQNRFAIIEKTIHNTPKGMDIQKVELSYFKKFADEQNRMYTYDATEVLNQMLKKGENL